MTLVFVEVKWRQKFPNTLAEMTQLLPTRKRIALTRGILQTAPALLELTKSTVVRVDLAIVWGESQKWRVKYIPNCFDIEAIAQRYHDVI